MWFWFSNHHFQNDLDFDFKSLLFRWFDFDFKIINILWWFCPSLSKLHSILTGTNLLVHKNITKSYYVLYNSLRLKASETSKWASKHLWGTIYFAVYGVLELQKMLRSLILLWHGWEMGMFVLWLIPACSETLTLSLRQVEPM